LTRCHGRNHRAGNSSEDREIVSIKLRTTQSGSSLSTAAERLIVVMNKTHLTHYPLAVRV
jgi:hypothetical protein